MTLQTTATDRHDDQAGPVDVAFPALAPLPKAHWREHTASEFPHRDAAEVEHGPNLATLDQLRTGGRNALLSPRHRRRAKPRGCTTC